MQSIERIFLNRGIRIFVYLITTALAVCSSIISLINFDPKWEKNMATVKKHSLTMNYIPTTISLLIKK
jgi:hypothetical protein